MLTQVEESFLSITGRLKEKPKGVDETPYYVFRCDGGVRCPIFLENKRRFFNVESFSDKIMICTLTSHSF